MIAHNNMVLIKPEFLVVYAIEELVLKKEKHSLLTDIHQDNKAG